MVIALPLLVSIVGLLMYALCVNPKLQHIGDVMFWTGLLVFLLRFAGIPLSITR
jgi:hypothetical protein